jgi:plastocyanin
MLRTRIAVLAVCALLSATAVTRAGVSQVTIDNFAFTPAEITVSPGTTITWLNRDDIPHTVTDAADPKAFKSAPLDTGDSFSHTFAEPGTYRYFCSLHAHMQGTIVVR